MKSLSSSYSIPQSSSIARKRAKRARKPLTTSLQFFSGVVVVSRLAFVSLCFWPFLGCGAGNFRSKLLGISVPFLDEFLSLFRIYLRHFLAFVYRLFVPRLSSIIGSGTSIFGVGSCSRLWFRFGFAIPGFMDSLMGPMGHWFRRGRLRPREVNSRRSRELTARVPESNAHHWLHSNATVQTRNYFLNCVIARRLKALLPVIDGRKTTKKHRNNGNAIAKMPLSIWVPQQARHLPTTLP
jgi:hypothetical protein